jgi:hypothetical protein
MQRERHSGSLEDVSLHATVSRTELLRCVFFLAFDSV